MVSTQGCEQCTCKRVLSVQGGRAQESSLGRRVEGQGKVGEHAVMVATQGCEQCICKIVWVGGWKGPGEGYGWANEMAR
jgi:hypothetical protein